MNSLSSPPLSSPPIITYEDKKKDYSKDQLSIALISTPFFTVPPKKYGGLEQVIWDLAVGLDQLGHEVTIFSPEGSKAPEHGQSVFFGPSIDAVNVDWYKEEEKRYHAYKDLLKPERYDVIIDSTWFGFAYLSKIENPKLRLMHVHHGGMVWDCPPPVPSKDNLKPNLVAISNFMKSYTENYFKQKGFNINVQYVLHGIDLEKYPYQNVKSDHLLFVGRLSTFKQPHWAVDIARKTDHKLDLIGASDFVDSKEYVKKLEEDVENDKNITLIENATQELKIEKMKDAKALIFPSKMGEPAGLVAMEAMSCGTPVIALNDGAISEYVIHGKTGFICNSKEEMIDAVKNIDTIKPEDCRVHVELNHSRIKMATGYLKLCYKLINNEDW